MELNKIKAKRNGLETTMLNLILEFENETEIQISYIHLIRTDKFDGLIKRRPEDVGIVEKTEIDLISKSNI